MMSGTSGGPNMLEDTFMVDARDLHPGVGHDRASRRPDGRPGTEFDWDENFGGMDGSRFRVDGAWRFADRHKVRGMWFNFARNRSTEFNEEVEWGDVTFPVDVTVDGSFEFDIYELAYEYAFLKRENLELSGSFGFHLAQFEVGMTADVDTGGGGGTVEIGDKGELNAPLPVIGGRVIYGAFTATSGSMRWCSSSPWSTRTSTAGSSTPASA